MWHIRQRQERRGCRDAEGGTRGWDVFCKTQLWASSFSLLCVQFDFPFFSEGMCNVCRHTCTHTHRGLFVCTRMLRERRETYKLLTAAYSRNSFCLMALLGFLIVMTNWLPSNAEMGKASWSYRRNMRTHLTMCKGTQGLFYFFFFFDFFFFSILGEKTGKEAWSETM